jgi:hypothetical protein
MFSIKQAFKGRLVVINNFSYPPPGSAYAILQATIQTHARIYTHARTHARAHVRTNTHNHFSQAGNIGVDIKIA